MCKIVICDLDHKDIDEETKVLQSVGMTTKWLHCKTQREVIENCQGAVVLLNQYVKMDRVIFEALPTVKCIVRYGVGYDSVNLADATEYGVQICNVPDYGTGEVADHALTHALNLARKISLQDGLIKKGIWDYRKSIPVFRLSEATVGVFGVGRIGTSFAQKIRPLCKEVIAYDTEYGKSGRTFPDFVKFVSFEELLRRSDIVSVHSPLSESTYHVFNERTFAQMKDTAYLINVSRGGIVDEEALYKALKEGKIAGAALDVVEKEPLTADDPLLSLENFIVSPHSAWYSLQSALDMKRKVAEEAVRFIKGEKVKNPVNNIVKGERR